MAQHPLIMPVFFNSSEFNHIQKGQPHQTQTTCMEHRHPSAHAFLTAPYCQIETCAHRNPMWSCWHMAGKPL